MARKLLIPGTLGPLAPAIAVEMAVRGFDPMWLDEVGPEDIDVGLAHIDNDVCSATVAALGQFMRWFRAHVDEGTGTLADGVSVLAPDLCRECRSISLPDLLPGAFSRAGFHGIDVVPLTSEEALQAAQEIAAGGNEFADGANASSAANDGASVLDQPVIGLCGNMPVLTTREFAHVVIERLEQENCRVLTPPLDLIADQRDFLTPALEFFAGRGVETVVCILPFGCLGGHAYARAQMRKLLARFEGMELTILDYDPSASDINLVNRTELIIQSARERAEQSS